MYKNLLVTISTILVGLPYVHNANILFATITPSISHQIVFQAVWKELSLRGHNVHVITPNPLNDPSLTNLTEIDISSFYVMKNQILPSIAKFILEKPSFFNIFLKDYYTANMFSELLEHVFNHENVKKFLNENHQFDLVITEWIFPTLSALAAKYNCPLIGITSYGAPIAMLDAAGNPSHPIVAPDQKLPLTRDMNFKERLMSLLYSIYARIHHHLVVLPREDAQVRKYLGDDLPYLGDIERNISVLLLNRNVVFHRIVPNVPAVVDLGGIQLIRPKRELNKELKKFLDESTQGVIYFSLGSNIKSIYLPAEIRNTLRETFAQLPYNVVWKWEEGDLPEKPSNVFTQSWLPQQELLGHPNVKLFITQGGLQSTEDAIKNHVPIIGIPFQSDQTTNVDTCVKYGIGIGIDSEKITVENLNYSIHQIIKNVRYKESAVKLSKLLNDQPRGGLEKAIWWTEYVIRHKGAKHLRSPSIDISWIQYLMLDIFAFLLATLFLVFLVICLTFKLMASLITTIKNLLYNRKHDVNKKNK